MSKWKNMHSDATIGSLIYLVTLLVPAWCRTISVLICFPKLHLLSWIKQWVLGSFHAFLSRGFPVNLQFKMAKPLTAIFSITATSTHPRLNGSF